MTSQKKIALIIPGGLGTGRNNMGVPVLEEIVNTMTREFDITVFQLYQTNPDYEAKGFVLLDFKSGNKLFQYCRFFVSFFRAHRSKQFAAIHGFWVWPCGILAVFLGRVLSVKSVVSVLGGDGASVPKIDYGHLRSPLSRKLILWSLARAGHANALTVYLENNLKEVGLKRKLQIIPWGVNSSRFQFRDKPLQDPIQFLHIANLHPVKDQEMLLRAFGIIHSILPSRLTIVGEGVEEQNVRRWILQFKLQDVVNLEKQVPYDQIPSVYHRSDILLHTSLTEGQSEVVTEAMTCGLLVAGTHVGLLHDLPHCCISVPVGDYQQLAESVIAAVNDPAKIKTIRQAAHQWAIENTLQRTVSQITELY